MSVDPNLCAYCSKLGKSKEHYWGRWSQNYHLKKTNGYTHEWLGAKGVLRRAMRRRQGSLRLRQVRAPCETCNNGWMNNLNQQFEPVVRRMMSGDWKLTETNLQSAAAWFTMFTMSYEFHDLETMASRQVDRSFLREFTSPPANWYVFVAPHEALDWAERIGHTGVGAWLPANVPTGNIAQRFRDRPNCNFQVTVSTFGSLAFMTVSAHSDALNVVPIHAIVADAVARGFRKIWPVPDRFVPPIDAVNSGDMDAVANDYFRHLNTNMG